MAIIKCKMCGGDITLNEDRTLGMCDYCGSTMTLPKVSDEQRAARFNRGNHFRRQGEFDKALAVYESIVREDDADAEAHWCCALCRFGIEYVEDPNTLEYLPTCHRASFDSFLEDVDYQAALEHSNGVTKRQYQKDAAKIAEVQRGILATSQNEEPFDVFICYKETDDQIKERTRDSLDAQEIYYQLSQAGYRVFFSRITLEDKAGAEYEPYIFAALNSAKVMVAIGSKSEYFNAVWVKNEWSRFLALMRKDRSKLLLPCYRNMDPYDLPDQLSVLQSYDMARIGFMQDLIRGIKKVLNKDEPKPAAQQIVVRETGGGPNVSALLDRGAMALEDSAWDKAAEYYDQVLNQDAKNGNAFLGLALCGAKCGNLDSFVSKLANQYSNEPAQTLEACKPETKRIDELSARLAVPGYLTAEEMKQPFVFPLTYPSREAAARQSKEKTLAALRSDRNYTRAVQYADPVLKDRLAGAERQIAAACDRRINQAKTDAAACKADVIKRYQAHLNQQEQAAEKKSRQAQERREMDYQAACERWKKANTEKEFRAAEDALALLSGYKDANTYARDAHAKADALRDEQDRQRHEAEVRAKREAERKAKKRKRTKLLIILAAVLAVAAFLIYTKVIIPNNKYEAAVRLYENGKYAEAIAAFEALDGYKDSKIKIKSCETAILDLKYEAAVKLYGDGKYEEAIAAFKALDGYKDSKIKIKSCETAILDLKYEAAAKLYADGKYEDAIAAFQALDRYKDSKNQVGRCETAILDLKYEAAEKLYEEGKKEEAIAAFQELDGYKDSTAKLTELRHSSEWMNLCPVGETVFFGNYEQDNDISNGKEDIEWIVLAKNSNRILVISKYALDCKQYDKSNATWETCSLRKWLNETFLSAAFSSEEQNSITESTVRADNNPSYSTSTGKNTTDKIFLLSINEVNKYFSSDYSKRCATTDYAIAQGAYSNSSFTIDGRATGWWWLRSPGNSESYAAIVNNDGSVSNYGIRVDNGVRAVRPALWINLDP